MSAVSIVMWVVVGAFVAALGTMSYRRVHTPRLQDRDDSDFEHMPQRSGMGERTTGIHMEPPVEETRPRKAA